MTRRKKLIEVALPLKAINEASAREKSIRHGHPSTLHLWWARRPLAAARAVIFASLVDDPDDPAALPEFVEACRRLPAGRNVETGGDTPRMRLFDFIERLVTWEATHDENIMTTARDLIRIATGGNPPPLLDPFAGGGSIPLEAQRLGLEAYAGDLNPVAVMINKAQIEIPPRFANRPPVNPRDREQIGRASWRGAAGLAADIRHYGAWMRDRAWERIGHLYPTHRGETVIAWLWARTVKSPNPAVNGHVPLVKSFVLSRKKGRECWAKPIVIRNPDPSAGQTHAVRFEVVSGRPPEGDDGTVKRTGARCIISGEPIPFDYIRAEGRAGRMGAMLMAVVTEGEGGRNYHGPDNEHMKTANEAQEMDYFKPRGEMPRKHRNFSPPIYGMYEYGDLFTPRQLVALTTFSDLVSAAREQIYRDALAAGLPDDDIPLRAGGRGARAYAEAVSVYLAFGVDRLADRSSSICSWDSGQDKVRNTFGRQAIPMIWDYAEANPFSDSSGNFLGQLDYAIRVVESLPVQAPGVALQRDASGSDAPANGPILLSTDPPYYDNIGYADLSDFFYIWLRRSLRDVYPELFSTLLVPKAAELIASPHRHGGKAGAKAHFENGMLQTFRNIRRFVTPDYPLTVYYAYKQRDTEAVGDDAAEDGDEADVRAAPAPGQHTSTGWETMLTGLIEAGFTIDGTWPMRTELSNRMLSLGTNALASSIVLVCRPRAQDAPPISRRQFIEALRRELPAALQALQSSNIAPVDLAQACIGPGMAIYSRYSRVLEANGTPLGVRTALGLINAALDEYLAEQDGDIDADTRFAVAWFEQFGFESGEFGAADTLARAKNTSVDGVAAAGLVVAARGQVRLLPWDEYADSWDPQQDRRATVWEATHHLIRRLKQAGETGAAGLLAQLPPALAAEARGLAYRLYHICERKGWTEYARNYNDLVSSWTGISEEGARLREAARTGQGARQMGLGGAFG